MKKIASKPYKIRKKSAAPKTLVIAEKPSVARDLLGCLADSFQEQQGFYEGESYVVSFSVGHLLRIAEPQEIAEKYRSWALSNLPILPTEYPLKPVELPNSKKQLKVLEKLLLRSDITKIINACDAGREGELIFRYLLDYVYKKVPEEREKRKVLRLWLRSMTVPAIKRAFTQLRQDEEMLSLARAAKSRAEADWLVGINGSRGLTGYNSKQGGFFKTPCGRVQTPTLSLLVKREQEREKFVPRPFWQVTATFKNGAFTYEGKWFDAAFSEKATKSGERRDRIFNEALAEQILKRCQGKNAVVEENEKPANENCPLLYDLTSLQREANTRWGFSARNTLSILQSLYEKYKLVTYPRTSSRYLPEDYLGIVKETFLSLSNTKLRVAKHMHTALEKNYLNFNRRIFNNKKIGDHHAIIPTPKKPGRLSEAELKLYTMVVERFTALFFPPLKLLRTIRISKVGEDAFKTEGKKVVALGWKVVYEREEKDKLLAKIDSTKPVKVTKLEKQAFETAPPSRYSEALLLATMEGAGRLVEDEVLREAMKERGLGTPATRATIIEKLKTDGYVVKEGSELLPTSKAFDLFRLLGAMEIKHLQSPQLTGDFEYKLSLIEKKQLGYESFMEEVKRSTIEIVEQIQQFDEMRTKREASFSPVEMKHGTVRFFEYLSKYASEDNTILIRKIIGGRLMSETEVFKLLTQRTLGPFEDFRSKKGKPFAASLRLDDQNKVKLVFLTASESEEETDLSQAKQVGSSYLDNSEVFQTLTAYISKSYLEKKTSGIRISRVILGKEISEENFAKMLRGEKSELIKGFRSAKTKRLFDAYLEITPAGKLQFSFPPRKAKKAVR